MAEDLFHRTDQNKVRLEIYFIENAEIKYYWEFNQSEIQNESRAKDLFHQKCWFYVDFILLKKPIRESIPSKKSNIKYG